jgi:hypothetical protein
MRNEVDTIASDLEHSVNQKTRLIAAVVLVVQAIALDAYSGPTTAPVAQSAEVPPKYLLSRMGN